MPKTALAVHALENSKSCDIPKEEMWPDIEEDLLVQICRSKMQLTKRIGIAYGGIWCNCTSNVTSGQSTVKLCTTVLVALIKYFILIESCIFDFVAWYLRLDRFLWYKYCSTKCICKIRGHFPHVCLWWNRLTERVMDVLVPFRMRIFSPYVATF